MDGFKQSVKENHIQELPTGNNSENQNSEFKKIIDQSKQNIMESQSPKRGPGRPKKVRPEQSQAPIQNSTEATGTVLNVEPPPDLTNELKMPLQIISQIPAKKYDIPELALADAEAQALAESLNKMINAFIPDVNRMDPKTASIVSLGMVAMSIGYQKHAIFSAKTAERMAKKQNEMEMPPPPIQSVDVGNYFNTKRV